LSPYNITRDSIVITSYAKVGVSRRGERRGRERRGEREEGGERGGRERREGGERERSESKYFCLLSTCGFSD
jgi:hypothetical protein